MVRVRLVDVVDDPCVDYSAGEAAVGLIDGPRLPTSIDPPDYTLPPWLGGPSPPDAAAEPQPDDYLPEDRQSPAVASAPASTPQQPTPAESRRNAIQAVQHRYTWAGLEIAKRKAEIKELRAAQAEAMDELRELVGDGEWSEGVDGGVAENCCAGLGNAEWTVEVTAEVTGAGCPAGEAAAPQSPAIANEAANAATPPDGAAQPDPNNPNHTWQSVPIDQLGFPAGIAKILRDDNGIQTLGELEALGEWWKEWANSNRIGGSNPDAPSAWSQLRKLGPRKKEAMADVLWEWWRRHPKEAEKVGRGYGQ